MAHRLRPYLTLCRPFLTPTAAGDSLAGHVLAAAAARKGPELPVLLAVLGSSVCLYWFGMATNDFFDREEDGRLGRRRPLATGELSPRQGAVFCAALGSAGAILAALAGALVPGAAIIVLALAYNAGGKRVPVAGSLLMGGTRAGNLLLGVASASDGALVASASVISAALVLGSFVAWVTTIGWLEERPHQPRVFWPLAAGLLVFPAALFAIRPHSPANAANAAALSLLLGLALRSAARARSRGAPAPATAFVRSALPGIFFVDAGVLHALAPDRAPCARGAALLLYVLFLWGWSWKRSWLQSGGPDT